LRTESNFAPRLNDIEPFRVMDVLYRAMELEKAGRDIVHMGAGEPDFDTALPIVEAGQQALAQGQTHYTQAAGIPQLRESIAQFYQDQYSVDVEPERIFVTPGASGALLLIAALLIKPGDGMLMTDPGYPCNRNFMSLVEGEGQLVPVGAEDCYQLNTDNVARYWQANTVGAMVASPANPTGEIIPQQQLFDLYDCVAKRDGYLVVDEIYHGLSYGEQAHSILEHTNDAFVINSFSKYFGMTGWRIGWLVAPENARSYLDKLAQNLFISTSSIAQHAALAAFKPATREILDNRREIFAERRDFLLPELRRIGFEIPHTPAGALYLYTGIKQFGLSSQQFCLELLNDHGVAITPGEDFGRYLADKHVRFSYTTDITRLEEAVRRLERWLM